MYGFTNGRLLGGSIKNLYACTSDVGSRGQLAIVARGSGNVRERPCKASGIARSTGE